MALKRTQIKRGTSQLKRTGWSRAIKSTFEGHVYASGLEARYAQELSLRKKAKDIKGWNRQKQVEVYVHGKLMFKYKLDFEILHNDGTTELVEVKGFANQAFPLRWKLFTTVWNHEHPKVKTTLLKTKDIL